MSADAWKRLIVAVGGLFTAIFFAVTQKELDPAMVQKVLDAVVWIVGLYLAQSGARAVMKERMAPSLTALQNERQTVGAVVQELSRRNPSGLPLNPNKDTP